MMYKHSDYCFLFVRPGLEHIRIIRDGTPNQYMVLLKFRDEVSHLFMLHIMYTHYSHSYFIKHNTSNVHDEKLQITNYKLERPQLTCECLKLHAHIDEYILVHLYF